MSTYSYTITTTTSRGRRVSAVPTTDGDQAAELLAAGAALLQESRGAGDLSPASDFLEAGQGAVMLAQRTGHAEYNAPYGTVVVTAEHRPREFTLAIQLGNAAMQNPFDLGEALVNLGGLLTSGRVTMGDDGRVYDRRGRDVGSYSIPGELPDGLDDVDGDGDDDAVESVECKFCRQDVPASTAHRHGSGWVGEECCWDERLRASE